MEFDIPCSITLLGPPEGVAFALQKGKNEIVDTVISKGKDLTFNLSFRVKQNAKTGMPNFLGPFAQGKPDQRFFYIRVGQAVGQMSSAWSRRVKLHLSSITWDQITQVAETGSYMLAASYEAKAKDGSPSCASVPLAGKGWQVVSR